MERRSDVVPGSHSAWEACWSATPNEGPVGGEGDGGRLELLDLVGGLDGELEYE